MRQFKSILIVFLGIMAFGIQDGFGQTTQEVKPENKRKEGLSCQGDFVHNGPDRRVECVCYEDVDDGTCGDSEVATCAQCFEIDDITDEPYWLLHLPISGEEIKITDWSTETTTLSNGGEQIILNFTPYEGGG